jgi:hypothetical protein
MTAHLQWEDEFVLDLDDVVPSQSFLLMVISWTKQHLKD